MPYIIAIYTISYMLNALTQIKIDLLHTFIISLTQFIRFQGNDATTNVTNHGEILWITSRTIFQIRRI